MESVRDGVNKMARNLPGVKDDKVYIEKDMPSGDKEEFDYVYDATIDAWRRGKTYMATR